MTPCPPCPPCPSCASLTRDLASATARAERAERELESARVALSALDWGVPGETWPGDGREVLAITADADVLKVVYHFDATTRTGEWWGTKHGNRVDVLAWKEIEPAPPPAASPKKCGDCDGSGFTDVLSVAYPDSDGNRERCSTCHGSGLAAGKDPDAL